MSNWKPVQESFGKTLAKLGTESIPDWRDRVGMAHESVLGRILPAYEILETLCLDGKTVKTFIYGSTLGLGVLSTNYTGESFMYFVEKGRSPMGFQTCSNFTNRFALNLAVREAYRLARLALQRGVFDRCYKSQYIRGAGQIRRVAV